MFSKTVSRIAFRCATVAFVPCLALEKDKNLAINKIPLMSVEELKTCSPSIIEMWSHLISFSTMYDLIGKDKMREKINNYKKPSIEKIVKMNNTIEIEKYKLFYENEYNEVNFVPTREMVQEFNITSIKFTKPTEISLKKILEFIDLIDVKSFLTYHKRIFSIDDYETIFDKFISLKSDKDIQYMFKEMSKKYHLDRNLIQKYNERLDFNLLLFNEKIPNDIKKNFIKKNISMISTDNVNCAIELMKLVKDDEDFIEDNIDTFIKILNEHIYHVNKLFFDENFIRKYKHKLNWKLLSEYYEFSENFLGEMSSLIDYAQLLQNSSETYISKKFFIEHYDEFPTIVDSVYNDSLEYYYNIKWIDRRCMCCKIDKPNKIE